VVQDHQQGGEETDAVVDVQAGTGPAAGRCDPLPRGLGHRPCRPIGECSPVQLVSWLGSQMGYGLHVDGFLTTLLGGVIVRGTVLVLMALGPQPVPETSRS
jgi:hypothetical protein